MFKSSNNKLKMDSIACRTFHAHFHVERVKNMGLPPPRPSLSHAPSLLHTLGETETEWERNTGHLAHVARGVASPYPHSTHSLPLRLGLELKPLW